MRTLVATVVFMMWAGGGSAQDLPLLTPSEYGRWENLAQTVLSPSGNWVAYRVTRVDEESELRIWHADRDTTAVFPWGSAPVFGANDSWVAWTVGLSPDAQAELEEADEPVRMGAALMALERGEEPRTFEEVSSFSFDASGRYLALTGYPPDEPDGKGSDVRVLDLNAGTETTFGNAAALAWSDSLSLLAMAVSTGEDSGNGVQLYDATSGRLRSLDASGSTYTGLSWRESATDLAVLRSDTAASIESTGYDVLAWRDPQTPGAVPTLLLGAHPTDVADTLEVVAHRTPEWSPEGDMILIGLRPVEEDASESTLDESESEEEDAQDEDSQDENGEAADEEPELPGVQIWHTGDVEVYAQQAASASRDAQRTLAAVWHVDDGRVVQLGSDLEASIELVGGWRFALEQTSDRYGWGEMFGRPYQDVWTVDARTGARAMTLERVRYAWPSDGGEWLLSFDGDHYTSLNLQTGERFAITENLPTTFADTAYDTPTDILPPVGFGPGGWLENEEGVLLYDHHDIWRIAPDGTQADRLTDGSQEGTTHRIARLTDHDGRPGIDPLRPLHLTLYNERTEERGFALLEPSGEVERLVWGDAMYTGLVRADSAAAYGYRMMSHDDPPDFFLSDARLSAARRVTDINPFMSEYAWGTSELVNFESESGRPLQAVLRYPANYKAGTRVPMIVYTYEMLSQGMHQFRNPSERDYYNFTAWTQQGYAVLLPDIVYRPRDPGVSALESVRAAVATVVEMGVADPEAVGLIGHSWGGYQATFLPTRTDIFAASVAGAPLTDFVSFMGALHWNPGLPELSHWETGQARMEVPFWEDPEAHRRNSPIHEVQNLETPLLMAFGNEDGVVDWDQGTEFYNFARRAGKQMVLLVYEGEDHGFRQEANQVDYHRRILEWFGHYLKGEPAPAWITDGVRLDDMEIEKKRVAKGTGR